jgi:hypothetical protein
VGQMARLIEEFQASINKTEMDSDLRHHEQTRSTQITFYNQVKVLSSVIEDMGNPFIDDSNDLLVLDTRDLADPAVINALYNIEKTGRQQYDTFVDESLITRVRPVNDPIKRNNFPLFSRQPVRNKSLAKHQLLSMKSDCSLFSSLFISCQTREGDLDEFFAHENQACPPSISNMGKLRLGTKSDIVSCLEELIPKSTDDVMPDIQSSPSLGVPAVDAVILDGAVIVNMLKPGTARTFAEYATQIFLPYITTQLKHVLRVDLVWDEYIQGSLKTYTRSVRGKGSRRRVKASNTLPRNWQEFLRNDENKSELFSFLSLQIAKLETEKQIIVTHHTNVICTQPRDTSGISPLYSRGG